MTFAVTKYIYPIEKEIILSKTFDYKLDNPRNEQEVKIIKEFITATLEERDRTENDNNTVLPLLSRFGFSLGDLREKLEITDNNGYALKYYKDNYEKRLYDILAETWIILRYPEEDDFNKIAADKSQLFYYILGNDEINFVKNFNNISSYCHLVSLLGHNNSHYYGESFLLSENPYEVFFINQNRKVHKAIENVIGYNFLLKHDNRDINWLYWIDGINDILKGAERLDTLFDKKVIKKDGDKIRLSQRQSPSQKLLHVGSLLKTSFDHIKNPELQLLLLVSIIEYLITRNPDTSKFNVEDSISKQFRLKCAAIIHSHDKAYDLTKLNNELSRIYAQRSDLAHGNYKEGFKIDNIVDSVYLLYLFNRYIINEFIDDRELIEFLKDN